MTSEARARVLVACDAYLPGFKGGSLRSVAHMLARLGDEFEFHVLTGDRDYGDREPYAGIVRDRWVEGPGARVYYASAAGRRLGPVAARVCEAAPHLLYLNSVFSPLAARLLALRRAGRLPRGLAVVLAPTGELAASALAVRRWKKAPYLALARALGLFEGLRWRAADEREAAGVRRAVRGADVRLAGELPPLELLPPPAARPKLPGQARVVYLSRVAPEKNLLLLIDALRAVRAPVELAVYGPLDDRAYWARCQGLAALLPAHVTLTGHGALPHEQVAGRLAEFDALALPTRGESFGYVVLEALGAGCPVLLSDRTPWRDLEARGAGRVLPLEAPAWTAALEELAGLGPEAQRARRAAARRWAEELCAAPGAESDLRALLRAAIV